MTKIVDAEITARLERCLAAGVTDPVLTRLRKQVRDLSEAYEEEMLDRIKDELAVWLSEFVNQMAESAINAMLQGNQDQMLRYLGCERGRWTGRSDSPSYGIKRDNEWHPVIHGKLFEQGAVALRRQIVDANRDLIVNERILDLEDQVKCLVAQVNKATAENERLAEINRQDHVR